jgi:hypothetical protein
LASLYHTPTDLVTLHCCAHLSTAQTIIDLALTSAAAGFFSLEAPSLLKLSEGEMRWAKVKT